MVKNIVLDFGHGGLTSKGVYTTAPNKMYKFPNGEIAYEGQLNRQIGGFLYTFLNNNSDLNIICTVKEDDPRDVSLGYRVRVANNYSAKDTIFISIHCNAGGGTGFEIFTTKGTTKSDVLAESISDNVEILYKRHNLRLRYDFSDGDKDKESDFYVLRKTKCPAVLVECGFFDNENDFMLLSNPEFQCKVARNISRGILKYIENETS